jgi:hypothetical protein
VRFYRVSKTSKEGHAGYGFFTSRRDAEAERVVWEGFEGNTDGNEATVEEIEVVPTRTGIRLALNKYASHFDNG